MESDEKRFDKDILALILVVILIGISTYYCVTTKLSGIDFVLLLGILITYIILGIVHLVRFYKKHYLKLEVNEKLFAMLNSLIMLVPPAILLGIKLYISGVPNGFIGQIVFLGLVFLFVFGSVITYFKNKN